MQKARLSLASCFQILCFCFFTTLLSSGLASATSFADAVEKAAPAVVSIHTTKEIAVEVHPFFQDPMFRHFFGDMPHGHGQRSMREQQPGLGSGVIVDANGTILTNNHVIQDATEIVVKLADGREAQATLVGSDSDSDLAVLKINQSDLPVIGMGDSSQLRVGDVVLAIGNPFGVGQTVTQGIVSATQRNGLGINAFENFIQTDASINPGNSGGALINTSGELIGINTAIFSRSGGNMGIGFAIPTELAKDVMEQIVAQGHVTRGWLGITIRALTDDIRESINYPEGEGALVDGVMRGGPAHKAGLLPGDVIISLNGLKTDSPVTLRNVTADLEPGDSYPIVVVRGSHEYDFRVVIGKRPTQKEESPEQAPDKPHRKK